MVRIPYESRAIHRPKQSQQKASSCQKNGARVVSHSGERTVRIRKVVGSIPIGSTKMEIAVVKTTAISRLTTEIPQTGSGLTT